MKKLIENWLDLVLIFCLIVCSVLWMSSTRPDQSPTFVVAKIYAEGALNLQNQLTQLEKALESKANTKGLERSFKSCRLAYKTIEPISTYYFAIDERNFNGAPLMSFTSEGMAADAFQPQGLQILEETLFAGEKPDYEAGLKLTRDLIRRTKEQRIKAQNIKAQDREVFEMCRQQIIRINTMTITGFDSPVFSYSLEESHASLSTVRGLLQPYLNTWRGNDTELCSRLEKLLTAGLKELQKSDFDSFDRVNFTRNITDVIYGDLLALHRLTGVETVELVSNIPQKVNYNAKSLYDEDFLNIKSFSRFGEDELSEKQIALGKTLFFDPVLSGNNKRACASCHQPAKGFGDGRSKSLAFDMQGTVDRNSPTLLNSALQNEFFWDLRSENLNNQIDHVVMSKKEFHTDYTEMIVKLRKSEEYVRLFNEAYRADIGDRIISITSIKQLMAGYVRSLTSINSEFDQYMRRENEEINEEVVTGYNLFMGKAACGTCHFAPTFFGTVPPHFRENEGEVLGTPATADNTEWDKDMGRWKNFIYYNFDFLKGQFKTPTVRNAEITGPYMHNGVYETLEEVIDFYNAGGGEGMGLKIPVQTLPADSLHLNENEKESLIAFIRSLTDTGVDTSAPKKLPAFPLELGLNSRVIGGEY